MKSFQISQNCPQIQNEHWSFGHLDSESGHQSVAVDGTAVSCVDEEVEVSRFIFCDI